MRACVAGVVAVCVLGVKVYNSVVQRGDSTWPMKFKCHDVTAAAGSPA